jgi:1-acyl-sn-glycerol-3-phosphate acyltransferase
MAKRESFDPRNGLFEYLMVRLFGAFPVDREHPGPEVIHRSEEILRKGSCIGIFPEAHRYPDKKLHKFEPGVAYLAYKTGATILPIGMTEEKGKELKVNIGKPFKLPPMEGRPRELLPKINQLIRDKIAELLPPDWEIEE